MKSAGLVLLGVAVGALLVLTAKSPYTHLPPEPVGSASGAPNSTNPGPSPSSEDSGTGATEAGTPSVSEVGPPVDADDGTAQGGIQWFATWESGLREAQRSGRPILLVSAAPHCAGVSGI